MRSMRGENSVEHGSMGKHEPNPRNPINTSKNWLSVSSLANSVGCPLSKDSPRSVYLFSPSPSPSLMQPRRSPERSTRPRWPQFNLPTSTTSSSLEVAAEALEVPVAPPRTERKSRSSNPPRTTEAPASTSVRTSAESRPWPIHLTFASTPPRMRSQKVDVACRRSR